MHVSSETSTVDRSAPAGVSFRSIYDDHASYVVHSLMRLGVHPRHVEDVTQEVFLAVYQQLHAFDATRAIRPWLFAFVFRVGMNHQRSAKIRLEDLRECMDDWFSGNDEIPTLETRLAAWNALSTLPPDQRGAFIMHDLEGHSLLETRSALGLSERGVLSALDNARAALRSLNDETRDAPS